MTVAHDSVPDAMLISNAAAELQTLARRFSQPLPVAQSVVTFQVVFVAGAASPWRLIETTRSTVGRRRRMLCFDSLEQIRRSVDERLAWQRADEQLALIRVRRENERFLSGRETHPATAPPAGSNRSGRGGNETIEAFDVKATIGWSTTTRAATSSE